MPTLPASAAAVPAPVAVPAPGDPPLSGRVLLVEDHPVNQKVAQKLLERLGLTVEVADNGEVALEKMHGNVFAMVLMDCQMPVLDGYSATRRLREIVATMPIEFLLLETDSPDQPLHGHQGARNEPALLVEVCECVATLRGAGFDEIATATTRNAERLFALPASV